MDKCPCENCLVLAMCRGDKILHLISKCDRLLNYVRNTRRAMIAIEIIKPPYYHERKNEGKLPSIANTVVSRTDMLYKKDKSHKKGVRQ